MLSITQNNSEFTMRPRNPFKMIEPFDYERDSEEEFNDMNGENLISDGLESDLDEYDQSLVEEGFIVGDNDYETFSDSEQEGINLLKFENQRRIKEMRKAMTQQKTDVQIQLDGFDDEYRAVNFLFKEFPIKTDEPEIEAKKQQKDHFADHFEEIAELIQGSRLNKEECIVMVCEKFPNVSKTSIRAFFKVCVNKDKMDKEDI